MTKFLKLTIGAVVIIVTGYLTLEETVLQRLQKSSKYGEFDNINIASLNALLSYPPMGSPYSEIASDCAKKPKTVGGSKGNYLCYTNKNSGSLHVFGPDRNLRAHTFSFENVSSSKDFIDDKEIIKILDKRFGKREITQTGNRPHSYTSPFGKFTAVSYGCKAFFFDKPSEKIPYSSRDWENYAIIWKGTGIPSGSLNWKRYDFAVAHFKRFDFEVAKSEFRKAPRCIVALINYRKTKTPTEIDEKQTYTAEVNLLEVDPLKLDLPKY